MFHGDLVPSFGRKRDQKLVSIAPKPNPDLPRNRPRTLPCAAETPTPPMEETEKQRQVHTHKKWHALRCLSFLFLSTYFFTFLFSASILILRPRRHSELFSSMSPPSVAQKKTERFLLGIFSQREEKEKRSLMRRTVLSNAMFCSFLHIQSSGVASSLGLDLECSVFYVFVLGKPTTSLQDIDCNPDPWVILNSSMEMAREGESDLLYLNIRENMNKGKSQTFFAFGAKVADLFGFSYIVKMDSDSYIHVNEMRSFMSNHLPVARNNDKNELLVYGGILMDYTLCGGSIYQHCNLLYPAKIYMQGGLYFLSSSLTKFTTMKCAIDPASAKQAEIEDMDMGLLTMSADNLVLIPLNHRSFWSHPIKNETLWKTLWYQQQKNEPEFTGCHFWPQCTNW